MDINISKLQKLVYSYMIKKRPYMILGAPGIGKSYTVRQTAEKIAAEKNLRFSMDETGPGVFGFKDVRASQLDPSDVRGIPFPIDGMTKWLQPNWLPREGEGVLFFDEINLAPPSIQSALYQLILDRRVGDYVLPTGWTIVAAGNRAEDKANVFSMAAPLRNRFSHSTLLVPSEEEWRDWAMEHEIRSDIIAFMAFKPSLLFKFTKDSKDMAFPTPRSWSVASFMTEGVEDLDDEFMLVASCVGEGAALEYQGFIKLKKKVNINDILKNPEKVKELKEVGLKYSLISGLADKYKSDKKLINNILAVVEHMDAEFGVFLLRLMKGYNQKTFVTDLMAAKNWSKLFREYNKFLL